MHVRCAHACNQTSAQCTCDHSHTLSSSKKVKCVCWSECADVRMPISIVDSDLDFSQIRQLLARRCCAFFHSLQPHIHAWCKCTFRKFCILLCHVRRIEFRMMPSDVIYLHDVCLVGWPFWSDEYLIENTRTGNEKRSEVVALAIETMYLQIAYKMQMQMMMMMMRGSHQFIMDLPCDF